MGVTGDSGQIGLPRTDAEGLRAHRAPPTAPWETREGGLLSFADPPHSLKVTGTASRSQTHPSLPAVGPRRWTFGRFSPAASTGLSFISREPWRHTGGERGRALAAVRSLRVCSIPPQSYRGCGHGAACDARRPGHRHAARWHVQPGPGHRLPGPS